MAVIPEDKRDLLERPVLAHAATVDLDGAPQCNPIWIHWDGEFLRFSQTPGRNKFRNLQGNPRIALSFVDPESVCGKGSSGG